MFRPIHPTFPFPWLRIRLRPLRASQSQLTSIHSRSTKCATSYLSQYGNSTFWNTSNSTVHQNRCERVKIRLAHVSEGRRCVVRRLPRRWYVESVYAAEDRRRPGERVTLNRNTSGNRPHLLSLPLRIALTRTQSRTVCAAWTHAPTNFI